jgi:hypothetical protein
MMVSYWGVLWQAGRSVAIRAAQVRDRAVRSAGDKAVCSVGYKIVRSVGDKAVCSVEYKVVRNAG